MSSVNLMYISNSEDLQFWQYGSIDANPLVIKPNEVVRIEMELDWSKAQMTRDFSLVVWAEDEPVTLEHVHGLESEEGFPTIQRR